MSKNVASKKPNHSNTRAKQSMVVNVAPIRNQPSLAIFPGELRFLAALELGPTRRQ